MSGDLKLEENQVIVEATTLACHSTDLVLDHPARRKSSAGLRRALVHDFNDGLTLNWDGDFPNGVTIKGKVRLSTVAPSGVALRVETADLELDRADRRKNLTPNRRALVHDFNDGLTINWNKDYPGGVTINGKLTAEDVNATDLHVNSATVSGLLTTHKVDTTALSVGGVHIYSGAAPTLTMPVSTTTPLHASAPVTAEQTSGPVHTDETIPANRHIHTLKIYRDTIKLETYPVIKPSAVHTLDLVGEIKALREELDALKAKVAVLESKG